MLNGTPSRRVGGVPVVLLSRAATQTTFRLHCVARSQPCEATRQHTQRTYAEVLGELGADEALAVRALSRGPAGRRRSKEPSRQHVQQACSGAAVQLHMIGWTSHPLLERSTVTLDVSTALAIHTWAAPDHQHPPGLDGIDLVAVPEQQHGLALGTDLLAHTCAGRSGNTAMSCRPMPQRRHNDKSALHREEHRSKSGR